MSEAVSDLWGVGVPDSAIIMLAGLMLKRVKLTSIAIDTRERALAVIKGLRPAVAKSVPLARIIPSAIGKKAQPTSFCSSCGKPLPFGSLCRTVWTLYDGSHIKCEGKPIRGFVRSKPEEKIS